METSTAVFSLVATAHPRYLYVSVTRALTHGGKNLLSCTTVSLGDQSNYLAKAIKETGKHARS